VIERYRYDAYGACTVLDADGSVDGDGLSDVKNPYVFTGRRLDAESGLMYYRFRDYSGGLGRFLERDPAGYADGSAFYLYCKSRPAAFSDPLGLYCGDCAPPMPRFPNVYRCKATDVAWLPAGVTPAMEEAKEGVFAGVAIVELIASGAKFVTETGRVWGAEGVIRAALEVGGEAAHTGMEKATGYDPTVVTAGRALEALIRERLSAMGIELYVRFDWESCDPCCKDRWEMTKHYRWYKCRRWIKILPRDDPPISTFHDYRDAGRNLQRCLEDGIRYICRR